jgi:arsenical resistance protein ArsH
MNILIFNGAFGGRTSETIASFLQQSIEQKGATATVFHLSQGNIPFLDVTSQHTPPSVTAMADAFRTADAHIWLTPLYHGGMTGAMKNCLDWLEVSAKAPIPYLSNKVVGLVCWAEGAKAMLGIQAMDTVAKSLRAWVLPYTVPMIRNELFTGEQLAEEYQYRLNKMVSLLAQERKL